MTIVVKIDNPDRSIVLDSVVEIFKGTTIFTSCASYPGWHVLNFRTVAGNLIQWDYGKDENGRKLLGEQYSKIIEMTKP
jgi:hypothetical protein